MTRRTWWMVLLGTGLALVGVWGAWVPHRAAALVLSAWDLAEYLKFVPGAAEARELFYLPVWCAGMTLALIATQSTNRRTSQLVAHIILIAIALGLMISILPPYPHLLNGYQSAEFRWRFILGASGTLGVSAFALLSIPFVPVLRTGGRWPARLVGGLIAVLALAGAIPALWQFLKVRGAIATLYGTSLDWGWGLGVFLVGWGLVGATGGWTLLRHNQDVGFGVETRGPMRWGR